MAKPTRKSAQVNETIESVTGIDRERAIRGDTCTGCGKEVNYKAMPFQDQAEYRISGLCSDCQAEVFG